MSFIQDFALKQNLTDRERAIIGSNPDIARGWTIAAGYAKMISNAYAYTVDDMGESIYLGKADAFRHCLWSALLAYQVGETYAKRLNDAHEREGELKDHNTNLDREMDYHNNAVGRRLGVFHAEQASVVVQSMTAFFLYGVCKSALDSGQLKVVDRRSDPWKLVPSDTAGIP